jgi:hypothetical protein
LELEISANLIERLNLTLRHGLAPLTRKSLMEDGTMQRIDDTAHERFPTMTEATASIIEGGLAY